VKPGSFPSILLAGTIAMAAPSATFAQYVDPEPLTGSGTLETRRGVLTFELGQPTEDTVETIYEILDFQRAVQAYLWALPIVAFEEARVNQMRNTGASDGDLVTYEGYRSVGVWLTANVTTPYLIGFADLTKTGPMVIELPEGAGAGMINDAWQRPVTDLGQSGPDEAKGARYLVTGPEQMVSEPQADFTLRSKTNNIIFMYRILETDPELVTKLNSGIRVYPYASRFHPPETNFLVPKEDVDLALHIQPRGLNYWMRLHAILQREPVAERDRFFMAMLRPLGIELGLPFEPNERQAKILRDAALFGEAAARATAFSKRFNGALYREDAKWDVVIQVTPSQDIDGWSQLDERAAYTYEAMLTSGGMVTQVPGIGQAYLGAYRDSEGRTLDGGKTYRLIVPPEVPAEQFWSITAYDADTRTLVRNDQQRADRSSRNQDLVVSEDGSTEIWFGPEAPEGKEGNWIPTAPNRAWFVYLRLYAPTDAYFERKWPIADIELIE